MSAAEDIEREVRARIPEVRVRVTPADNIDAFDVVAEVNFHVRAGIAAPGLLAAPEQTIPAFARRFVTDPIEHSMQRAFAPMLAEQHADMQREIDKARDAADAARAESDRLAEQLDRSRDALRRAGAALREALS